MNPGGRGCSEPRLHHCTLAWATRAKLHIKKKKISPMGKCHNPNINAPNAGAPRFIKQLVLLDLRNEIDGNTITVGNFNTPLTALDGSSRQKVKKGTTDLTIP